MEFTVTLTGTVGLIQHNARLANPLDELTQEIKVVTGKRQKTDADHREIARLEHAAGLYHDEDLGPYVPGENLARLLVDGGKLTRAGKKIERGIFITSDINPLVYNGPRDINGLWEDENFRIIRSVKVTTSRTMRCRPFFPKGWRVRATGTLDEAVISLKELTEITETAGRLIGLGDWRPRYGRFTATVEKI